MNINNLNKEIYYEVYKDNELVGVVFDEEYIKQISFNQDYHIIDKECFEYYDNGLYDDRDDFKDFSIINVIINNENKQYSFKNTIGFGICLIYKYCKDNNFSFQLVDALDVWGYDEIESFKYDKYENTPLVDKILSSLNEDNMSIISHFINVILYSNIQNEEELKKYEFGATHYMDGDKIKPLPNVLLKGDSDICLLDILTLKGLNCYSDIQDNKRKATERNDIIKWLTIFQLFANHNLTFYHCFYKMLLEGNIEDPFDFME